LKALIKLQYVDQIPKAVKGTVQQPLDKKLNARIRWKFAKCSVINLCYVVLFIKSFLGHGKKNFVICFIISLIHIVTLQRFQREKAGLSAQWAVKFEIERCSF